MSELSLLSGGKRKLDFDAAVGLLLAQSGRSWFGSAREWTGRNAPISKPTSTSVASQKPYLFGSGTGICFGGVC
jgi:hypothetical protein